MKKIKILILFLIIIVLTGCNSHYDLTINKDLTVNEEASLAPDYGFLYDIKVTSKEYFEEIIEYTDILFLSLKNDAVKLYDFDSIDKVMRYFWDKGVKIVVLKSHIDNGYYTGYNGEISFTEFYNSQKAIDTTASGDVFNGGYIYAITHGYTPVDATKFASVVSGIQTQNYGAIQPIPYKEAVLEKV